MRWKPEHYLIRAAAGRMSAAAYEWWMLLPVWLIAHLYGKPDVLQGVWLAAAIGLSVAAAGAGVWWHSMWQQSLAALAIAAGVGWFVDDGVGSIAVGALLWVGLMQGFTVSARYGRAGWMWVGVAVSFAVSVGAHSVLDWKALETPVLAAGIVNLAAALFDWNRRHLRGVSMAYDNGRRVPAELTRHNRVYLAVLITAVLALAAGVGGWLTGGLLYIVAGLGKLIGMLFHAPKPIDPEPLPQPTPPPLVPPPAPSEPSLLDRILDFLFHFVGYSIIAALVAWGLWAVYRNRQRIWEAISRLLSRILRSGTHPVREPSGFTDEETSLFSWEETIARLRKNRIGRLLTGKRTPRFEDMPDNREKARFMYRHWLRGQADRGYHVRPDLTPMETAKDAQQWRAARNDAKARQPQSPEEEEALIQLYYRARYRGEEPTDEQLNAIRRNLEGAR